MKLTMDSMDNNVGFPTYHEACELLSYGVDKGVFILMFRNEVDDDVVIDIPLHEDFLDAILLYRKAYKEHITKRLEE